MKGWKSEEKVIFYFYDKLFCDVIKRFVHKIFLNLFPVSRLVSKSGGAKLHFCHYSFIHLKKKNYLRYIIAVLSTCVSVNIVI